MTLLVLYVALALGVSFLCSVLEAVLLSISPSYIAAETGAGTQNGLRIKELKDDIDRPLAAILSLNTIAHTVGATGAGAQAVKVWGETYVGVISAVLTLLILVLSEIIPKTLGAVYWKRMAPLSARILVPLIWLMYPLVLMAQGIAKLMSPEDKAPTLSREEFGALADQAAKEGVVDHSESKILRNLMRMTSLRALDIMTPRTVLAGVDETTTVAEFCADESLLRFSRLLLFKDSLDEVTGYVLKDEVLLKAARGEVDAPLGELRREVLFIDDETPVAEVFEDMMRRRDHLVVMMGPYGSTSGIVTLEDVVETLLGLEIVDETDVAEDMQTLARKKWYERAQRLGLVQEGQEIDMDTARHVRSSTNRPARDSTEA